VTPDTELSQGRGSRRSSFDYAALFAPFPIAVG
jgi:hypothetical protein